MEINNEKFEKIKEKGEKFYKEVDEIYCPYLEEKIVFNAKGLEHLKFKRKNHARSLQDQSIRFKLIHLAPEVLRLSRTIQGVSHTKGFELIRTNSRTELILKPISYYEFIAILENIRVRVVVKQVDNGLKYFWSIIPFWKVDKKTRRRKIFNGNPETD